MRLYTLAIVAASLCLAAAGATADSVDPLSGTWKLVALERDGKPAPKDQVADELVISSVPDEKGVHHVVVIQQGKVRAEATIQRTESEKGAQDNLYDVKYSKGRHAGKTLRGEITIHLKGDTLKASWTNPDEGKGEGAVKSCHTFKRASDADRAKLPGTWKLVALERDGKPLPKGEVADELVITRLEGDESDWKVLVKQDGKVRAEATIQRTKGANAEKHNDIPYTKFDVTYSKGRHAGKTLHAFIHVDGDTLKAFWTKPDEGGEGAEKIFHTFKRAAGDTDKATKLPGTWKHASAERDGKSLPKEEFDNYPNYLVIARVEGSKSAFKVVMKSGDEVVAEATIKRSEVEKGAQHNQYDAAYSKGRHAGKTLHAAIVVDGDTLKACWTKPDDGGEGASQTCHTFKRVKE
jgi:uncharacterized protein (TIGR03067 family)